VLLRALEARHSPFSWFTGDWPLQNHFYRPVPTLAFEWDKHFYGTNAAGFGWTNDILCILCVLLLLWFVRELTDRPLVAGASAVVFASWHWGGFGALLPLLQMLMVGVLILGIVRHRTHFVAYVPAVLAVSFFKSEALRNIYFSTRMIEWLPGRTASVMTVFLLIALAAYARFERLKSSPKELPAPTPLTPPATRNTVIVDAGPPPRTAWIWIVVSCVGLWLALSSYEQAVMGPAVLLCVAVSFSLRGHRPRWATQGLFWGLLVAYLALRHAIVPSATSGYQAQQFRHGPGVALSMADYALPFVSGIPSLISSWDPQFGIYILVSTAFTGFFYAVAETCGALWSLRRDWLLAATGWAMSVVAYMPMAWFKQFDHYHYWPLAMRSIFVVALGLAAWKSVTIASRPPARQAPQRLSPAPGSLLRQ
jgi:hypothetical protein